MDLKPNDWVEFCFSAERPLEVQKEKDSYQYNIKTLNKDTDKMTYDFYVDGCLTAKDQTGSLKEFSDSNKYQKCEVMPSEKNKFYQVAVQSMTGEYSIKLVQSLEDAQRIFVGTNFIFNPKQIDNCFYF